jgi:hypothetical protein
MAGVRNDDEFSAANSSRDALGSCRHRSHIFITNHDKRWCSDLSELCVNALTLKDAIYGAPDCRAIANKLSSPSCVFPSTRRIRKRSFAVQYRHHRVSYRTIPEETSDDIHRLIFQF